MKLRIKYALLKLAYLKLSGLLDGALMRLEGAAKVIAVQDAQIGMLKAEKEFLLAREAKLEAELSKSRLNSFNLN